MVLSIMSNVYQMTAHFATKTFTMCTMMDAGVRSCVLRFVGEEDATVPLFGALRLSPNELNIYKSSKHSLGNKAFMNRLASALSLSIS
jgi:hypothetical protein